MHHVGLLAYGSLIDDPGPELADATAHRLVGVETPFFVEFARSSTSRDGAPTLVPVETGGAKVAAVVLVMGQEIDSDDTADMLWRRETGRIGSGVAYVPPKRITETTVVVKRLDGLAGIGIVVYTWIASNIVPLTAQHLAQLACASASATAGTKKHDGISYLITAKRAGIATPLMSAYEKEILKRSGTRTLENAWMRAQAQQ